MEGITGKEEITELWKSHFAQFCNCITDVDFQKIKYDVSYTNDIVVEISEVVNAIKHRDENNRLDDLTRFNKICHPSQRPRWQVDKEAIGISSNNVHLRVRPPEMCQPCY